MIDAIPLLLAPEGYQISRSVRLRSSASAYFNRTPASAATNGQKWTYSGWVKRGTLGSVVSILSADAGGGTSGGLYFDTDNTLKFGTGATLHKTSAAVFRDPSAWYHIVVVADSTLATGANRLLLYINGVPQTWTSGTDPTLNGIWIIGKQSTLQGIGFAVGSAASTYFDGYLTEINFIDGQALTHLSFGETNPVTGVWQPKKYTGTYGTNGFYLNFSDNSNNTAATIGRDFSGNGNNWTPNNINVSAYTGTPPNNTSYDSMLDVPTQWADGGNGRGNYCTLNRLVAPGLSGGGVLSNGNLRVSGAAAVSNAYARGTMTLSGKFYAEFSFDVVNATASIGVDVVTATAGALNTSSTNVSYRSGGNRRVLGTETAYGASWVANDIIGVAVDTAANTVEFFKNGTSQGVITSSAFFAQGDCVFAMSKDDVGSPNGFANFGQRPFSYTPPTGFLALNTLNLPEPTILKGNQFFDVALQTGNTTGRTVSGLAFQPDLVIVKNRAGLTNRRWGVIDSVRGVNRTLSTALTDAEVTSQTDLLTAFNSDGFTIGADAGFYGWNGFAESYAHFIWKEGPTQGFDIVTYTGNGTNRTISHSLGVAPSMIIIKNRSQVSAWIVGHPNMAASSPWNGFLQLNQTAAYTTSGGSLIWNNTAPTSSVFSVGTDTSTNFNGNSFVAYLFAQVAGFSRFGSYTGNGSADGPFVFCGFRPRWIMVKSSSAINDWRIYDSARPEYNQSRQSLSANTSSAEASAALAIDFTANGFKWREAGGQGNDSGATYIFAAFAENPFKNALAR